MRREQGKWRGLFDNAISRFLPDAGATNVDVTPCVVVGVPCEKILETV
jgi:hypothetical protein